MNLNIFDFDGTLVRTPCDTADNRKLYLETTGIPWVIDKKLARKLTNKLGRPIGMRRGWFGRRETLEPPLVPDPTPPELLNQEVKEAYVNSKSNDDAITIILTGRHLGLKHQVFRILGDLGIVEIERRRVDGQINCTIMDGSQILLLGDQGPFPPRIRLPGETFPWKQGIIQQYLDHFDITKVEMWEDRRKHVVAFGEWFDDIDVDATIHYIED